jgi:uncharacterized protein (TIGR00299 family) protein
VRVAYLDCVAGISGEMALGALVDAGADFDAIQAALVELPIEPFSIEREVIETGGIRATRIVIRPGVRGVIRTYASIRAMFEASSLPADAQRMAQRIVGRLAEAEATVHRKEVDLVTFHEIGEVETVAGVTGTALALSNLGIERVFASPVPTGLGMVRTEHGAMPVPGPTVVELLRGAPVYSRATPLEMVTPVGAAILSALAEGYGDLPVMKVGAAGYGAGSQRLQFPNVLRVLVGELVDRVVTMPVSDQSRVTLHFATSGLRPQDEATLLDAAHEAGAESAWLADVTTRDGAGRLLTVQCAAGAEPSVTAAVTSLLGLEQPAEDEGEPSEPAAPVPGEPPELRVIQGAGEDDSAPPERDA